MLRPRGFQISIFQLFHTNCLMSAHDKLEISGNILVSLSLMTCFISVWNVQNWMSWKSLVVAFLFWVFHGRWPTLLTAGQGLRCALGPGSRRYVTVHVLGGEFPWFRFHCRSAGCGVGFGFVCGGGLGFLTGAMWMGCEADIVAATCEGLISIWSTDRSASIAITLSIARDNSYTHTHQSAHK